MELKDFFAQHHKIALAFSGGVDSAFLLAAAKNAGVQVKAYFVKTEFQPAFELADARRLAAEWNAELQVLEMSVLEDSEISCNDSERCYFCKKKIFSAVAAAAAADGFTEILDGTNASDDPEDRPGTRAMKEFSVLSPLRDCGLTKEEIRRRSREMGLFTWNKPAYACLATRIPAGEAITAEKLQLTEASEVYLMSLGFTDFRIRMPGGRALVQIRKDQFSLLEEKREEIIKHLSNHYTSVDFDPEGR